MVSNIRQLMNARPFVPFTIRLADGKAFRIPTVDHIAVPPKGNRVFIFGDDGDYDVLAPLLIARVNVDSGEPAATADE